MAKNNNQNSGGQNPNPNDNPNSGGNNPNPDGQTQEQEKDKPKDTKPSALIVSYKKAYPKEKAFHVTSDNQVFLEKDLALAKMHQKKTDATKEVQTIEA